MIIIDVIMITSTGYNEKVIIRFGDKEDMYMNKISIPPIKIKKRIYDNQKFFLIIPVSIQVKIVWISKIKPKDIGCFICVNK